MQLEKRNIIQPIPLQPLEGKKSSSVPLGSQNIAKSILSEALAPVVGDLSLLNEKLLEFIPANAATTKEVLKHVFDAGGKRIRPALYFFACRLFNYRGDQFLPIAAVCEYVHTASLLHDDVVDDSSLRRGKPTANSIWGDQASVLVGDLIYARASELMAQTGSLEIVETFAVAIRHMSEGELFQLEQVFNLATTEETYFRILKFKTAVLIAASCKAAGILAGATLTEVKALEEFGAAVGMAFQLVDDALDYLGSREIFGKPTNSDLLEGKVTLPIILLKERATGLELESLKEILSKPKVTPHDIHIICDLVNKYDTAQATIDRANQFNDKALNALKVFPDSAARKDLETLAKRLVWRFN